MTGAQFSLLHLSLFFRMMIAIRVRYYSCLHSPSWRNPSSPLSLSLLSYKLTYLVWWLVGCCCAADRHTSLSLFSSLLVQSNSYFANIVRSYERAAKRYTKDWQACKFDSLFFILSLSSYVRERSFIHVRWTCLVLHAGWTGRWTHTHTHMHLARALYFLGRSVTSTGEYTSLTDDVKFLPMKTFRLIDSLKWRIFKCSTEEKKKKKKKMKNFYSCHSSNRRLMHLNIIAYIYVMGEKWDMIMSQFTFTTENQMVSYAYEMSRNGKKSETVQCQMIRERERERQHMHVGKCNDVSERWSWKSMRRVCVCSIQSFIRFIIRQVLYLYGVCWCEWQGWGVQ